MLYLLFELGQDRYALAASEVIEVLPLLDVKRVPLAVAGLVGLLNYHGTPLPLLDLTELALGKPSHVRMSTRIIVANYRDESGEHHSIGLMAERVTETLRCAATDFSNSGVAVESARFLGPVLVDAKGIIQRIELGHLLPEGVRAQIFAEVAG